MIRAALALLLATTPALAEPWACDMTVRCRHVDCAPIAERYTLIAADHEGRLFLSTPAGDRPVTRLTPRDAVPAAYAGAGDGRAGQLLTIFGDGQALLSIHGQDGAARTTTIYGICLPF